ncbi:hypothetical protein ALC152_07380 [Arcobacter sp. 15-2]|uniref:hypothetical protein n=1 Tax=Arcobacter sp. 15-2 TaxID=3374109 RepID=UPI00399C908D
MSKNEKIKEQIGWLKVVFGILSAVLVSMAGWLAANYNTSDETLVIITLCLIVFNAILIMMVNKKAYNKMDQLEDL